MCSTHDLNNIIVGMFLFFSVASANTFRNHSVSNSSIAFDQTVSVQNHSSQNSNATLGWTNDPSTRGTLDIIFSCLFTIIVCTWSAQHLDVPKPGQANLLRMIGYMALGVLCPESLFTKAIFDRLSNNQDMALIRKRVQQNPSIDMGGWIIQKRTCWIQKIRAVRHSNQKSFRAEELALGDVPDNTSEEVMHPIIELQEPKLWTHTHTAYVNMRGLRVVVQDSKEVFIIKGHHIAEIIFDPAYSPMRIFSMSRDEILDKSKEDWFTKLITVIQIMWLVLSVIARRTTHLPTSQLEILTLAFAGVAVATYIVQWTKPQGIEIPTTIHLRRLSDDPIRDGKIRKDLDDRKPKGSKRISMYSCISFTIPAILFGGIHLSAWNFHFPSMVELYIWRSATIIITVLPSVYCVPWLFVYLKQREWSDPIKKVHVISIVLCGTIYGLARLCVIGVAISSLRSMPADVYLSTVLSNFLPNIH